MKKIKIAVAMSGGVDSGTAAKLLIEQGYQVMGIHMRLWGEVQSSKCKVQSLEAAKETARLLGTPFEVIDLEKIFKKKVVNYFLDEYAAGKTPNPCVMCNKFIKFGELLDYVRKLGFDYLATGHYARIESRSKNQELRLLQAKDKSKDQSYFLYNLTQSQLAHILFPVGEYTKKQIRQIAKDWNLPVAERPESQEICFLAGKDYRQFLKRYIINSIKPGEVVDAKGKVIGKHSGLPLYTIGQRHGFTINSKSEIRNSKLIPPYYVIEKDILRNRLIVGFGKETERKEFEVDQVNLVSAKGGSAFGRNLVNLGDVKDLRVRIRSQGELLKCRMENGKWRNKKSLRIILDEPERGIAAGQAAVFYRNEEVLGGGIISN